MELWVSPTKQSGLATNRSTMDHSQLDPSVWLWLATMEHSLWLVLVVGTPLGLRPPTRPASMGGETPGNNYPVQFFHQKTSYFHPTDNYDAST